MTILFALLSSGGGTNVADEGHYWVPYYIGAGTLFILLAMLGALLAFGKGREHS